jgi:hypothetical protein
VITCFGSSVLAAEVESRPGPGVNAGQFWRIHWYERGLEHGNPGYDGRFRVNSPEVVLHPQFGQRTEARENGLMLLRAEEDLGRLTQAQLYLELWGGHPGSANKRVTLNGRSTYYLPRVGTEEMNCTYSYPLVELKISDLVNGYNACQFALDQGKTFWGHMIVDNACLRVALTHKHPDLLQAGLGEFRAAVTALSLERGSEGFALSLECPAAATVESVDFEGCYFGYDENGDTRTTDWHGFTKARRPVAILGTATTAPFQLTWRTEMLPAQKDVAVRAAVHFKGQTNLVYVTPARAGLEIAARANSEVTLYASHDLPPGFWSRANSKKQCTIYLDVAPARIERAELHVNAWTGGAGNAKDYFKLNGRHFPVAEGARHELIYSRLEVPREVLRQGINEIELLSDTEHHGIEILLPGPCLMVRGKKEAK